VGIENNRDYVIQWRDQMKLCTLHLTVPIAFVVALTSTTFAQTRTVLKAADVQPLGHPSVEAVLSMGRKLETATNGRLIIQMHPSMALGSEKEMIEQAQVGELALARVSVGVIGPVVPDLNVFNLPFLFRDTSHMEKIIDGPIGEELLKKVNDHPTAGLIGLGWMNAGSRNIYNNRRPVRSLNDLKGLKIRVISNPIFVDTINALGAQGVSIEFGQVVSSLESNVVDGAENNYSTYIMGRHYQHAKFFSLTEHLMIPEILIFSKLVWNTLSSEDQDLITKAAKEAQQEQRQLWYSMEGKYRKEMKEVGVEINPVADRMAFQDAVKPVWNKYGTEHADLIRRILDPK
jgi:tripartite ATP-independent transporter DctP family solute receptor